MDGVDYMRVKFYVDGSKRKGTATIDLKKVIFKMEPPIKLPVGGRVQDFQNLFHLNAVFVYFPWQQNDRGKYECRFLMVEISGIRGGTVVIEDNR